MGKLTISMAIFNRKTVKVPELLPSELPNGRRDAQEESSPVAIAISAARWTPVMDQELLG